MANTFNNTAATSVYKEEWASKLQERLAYPTCWKEVTDVIFSDTRVLHFPYLSTDVTEAAHTRDSGYNFANVTGTDSALSITTSRIAAQKIDRADLAQLSFNAQMEMADRQGQLLSERIETAFLADHASWTNVGDPGTGIVSGNATAITVAAANIDDIVRAVRRIVVAANGKELMARNGLCFVWRATDFEFLEQFAQSNGFVLADTALKNGIPFSYFFLGAYHYVSNSHTANHVFAGVRKIVKIGILRATWGQLVVTQDPSAFTDSKDQYSAVGLATRADYGIHVPQGHSTLVFDVNVA